MDLSQAQPEAVAASVANKRRRAVRLFIMKYAYILNRIWLGQPHTE